MSKVVSAAARKMSRKKYPNFCVLLLISKSLENVLGATFHDSLFFSVLSIFLASFPVWVAGHDQRPECHRRREKRTSEKWTNEKLNLPFRLFCWLGTSLGRLLPKLHCRIVFSLLFAISSGKKLRKALFSKITNFSLVSTVTNSLRMDIDSRAKLLSVNICQSRKNHWEIVCRVTECRDQRAAETERKGWGNFVRRSAKKTYPF